MRTRGFKSKTTTGKNDISRARLAKTRLRGSGEYTELTNEDMRNIIKGSGVMYGGALSKAKKADLIRGLDHIKKMNGAGFLDNLISRVKNLGQKVSSVVSTATDKVKSWLFFPPNKLPNAAAKVFEKYAKEPIKFIQVRREPLQSMVKKFLNFVSFGALENKLKELNYDDVMHLSMLVEFQNGKQVTIEKNERIAIVEGRLERSGKLQAKDVDPSLIKNITLETLLGKAQQAMGDFKFFQYNAKENNCQDFLLGILNANGLNDSNLQQFIKQDASEIFKALPGFFDKFAQGVTDLAGKASEVLGKGKRKIKKKTTKKRSIKK